MNFYESIDAMKNIIALEMVRAFRGMPDEFRVNRVISPESKEAGDLLDSILDDNNDIPDMFYENNKGIYNIIEFVSNDNSFDVIYGEGVIANTAGTENYGLNGEGSYMKPLGKDKLIYNAKAKPDFKILDCTIVGDKLIDDIQVIILSKRSSVMKNAIPANIAAIKIKDIRDRGEYETLRISSIDQACYRAADTAVLNKMEAYAFVDTGTRLFPLKSCTSLEDKLIIEINNIDIRLIKVESVNISLERAVIDGETVTYLVISSK